MSEEIIPTRFLLAEIRDRLGVANIPYYKFRKFYSRKYKVFFDCMNDEKKCLEEALYNEKFIRFVAFSIIKDGNGPLQIIDVSYANLGKETLERFVTRYPIQLKPSSTMALQLSGSEYLEFLGASYEE